ncbi:MAG TPA: MFS transporter [Dehalococcoidia bacterium]|nr:MFS transporter [Dehalococcoidia bacterium]
MAVGDPSEKQIDGLPPSKQTSSQPQPPLRPWSAFAFRDYRILWLSSAASLVTMQMRLLVAGVWLYEETGSGLQLGLLGVVQLAVQLPGILFGGALADQLDRKKLIAFTQSFSFVFLVILTLLMATGNLKPWHIYAVTAILGISSVLGQPARSAITANIVPRTHLLHAVTANTATFQVGAILAPLAFAVAFTRFGATTTFAIAAVSALPAAVLPLFIRTSGVAEDSANQDPMLRRMWEGFLFVKAHPILPGLYLMDVGVTIVSYYRIILPLIADKLFKAGAGAVGVLNAASSFGGVAGTFAVLFLANYRAKGMLVVYATLAYSLLLIVFGFNTSLWVATVILIGLGASDAIGMTTRQTTVQLTTPDNMRGRAVSFHSVSAMSANNLGTFEVGFMSEQIGAGNTLILGGVVGVVVVLLIWWLLKGIREYRYP